ncbi:MAG: pyruvate:ferredoxin (flavodoxin) oxidoreductase [Bacteroidetes bacterium]|nr:pyruvate:ferredoxin (flavodoxin) oxidoreductase [Bacteroidota bacterium]
MKRKMVTIDGNEACAYVAHKVNEVIAIYPITPSSTMGELADEYSAKGQKNIWGTVPSVTEMQSEGGAAGAVHGALQTGALTTTFTASQGLLLMIPNMYKIAGELTPTVFHVSARSLAAQGLSIFGDHSDVMATRQTGWTMLCANNPQETMDFALITQALTLESRIPVIHFFDGFRTSHEVSKIEQLTVEDMKSMISDELVNNHRRRALTPDSPVMRGTAQNPDVYFQGRETVNPYYSAIPGITQKLMDRFAGLTGRKYQLFDYTGAPDADRVIIMMGSGAETVEETIHWLNARGSKLGLIKVRLFRPFSAEHLIRALPATTKSIAVLDRTKEPGSAGEPLYQDVLASLMESMASGTLPFTTFPKFIGGRYGLSSKEFTPAMVKAVYDELGKDKPKNHFTIGIHDDVGHTSLEWDPTFSTEPADVFRGLFFGLGADGTVGANKNSIKIIGEETDNFAQGYFVYDSKKSGSMTTSHLRFGKKPIQSTYLITRPTFVACHQFNFVYRINMLSQAETGSIFLLNSPFGKDEVWNQIPGWMQAQLIEKKIRFYVIDALEVAKATGMGGRINTIMQTCFFAISGVLPREEAIAKIKDAVKKTYGKKGEDIIRQNFEAIDQTLANLFEVTVPASVTNPSDRLPVVSDLAPDFVKSVTAVLMSGNGDDLPVSKMPADGTWPTGTTQWEKRNIATDIPVWDPDTCIQCGKCALVCPHAVIRIKAYGESSLNGSPSTFKSTVAKGKEFDQGTRYTIQIAPEDCTGCELCVEVCPAKNKSNTSLKAINMAPQAPLVTEERKNWDFFLSIPEYDRSRVNAATVKGSQLLQPLFEFSGACAGCGETPYLKLISQLFGDRMVIANATGCSSIYGGNLPTTPWTRNADGRGPAWANSLFEDNAEFGLGYRLSIDKHSEFARELVVRLKDHLNGELVSSLLSADQTDEPGIFAQRERVGQLKEALKTIQHPDASLLVGLADYLVKKSVWIIGGDGWAYDIGYGGLDHVLASGRNVNILVLDTEVYSNTGGQMSKSTPMGAIAKFAAAGKPTGKKDLGLIAMSYGNVYVAKIAMGASDVQTIKAIQEAERYDGPSLIIAYSHCIAHGYNLKYGMQQQKLAVESGHWPLFRYNPVLAEEHKNPFQLDSKAPKVRLEEYIYNETRYKILTKMNPSIAKQLLDQNQKEIKARWKHYEQLAREEFAEPGMPGPLPPVNSGD